MEVKSRAVTTAKYFAHGALFSILSFALEFVFAFIIAVLVLFGALLGLILALVLIFIIWGILNSLIARLLWFPMQKGWKVWLGQGLALLLFIGLANAVPLILLLPFARGLPYLEYVIVVVLIEVAYAYIDGAIGMRVARHWKLRGVGAKLATEGLAWTPEPEIRPDNPKALHCPTCGTVNMVVAPDGSAFCLDCKRGIRREKLGRPAG